MVGIRIMDVPMPKANMGVTMAVRFTRRITRSMAMPVMLIVDVFMCMVHWFMFMLMFMSFS